MGNFWDSLATTHDNQYNLSVTENGALGYRTSGHALLDINFSASSLRKESDVEVLHKWQNAYLEDKLLAWKWLFFARDVRGGMGERRLFRVILKEMTHMHPEEAAAMIPLVAEYGRWDDLWCLLDFQTPYSRRPNAKSFATIVLDMVRDQLFADKKAMEAEESVSLLAKWLPSPNTSSTETRRLAKIVSNHLGWTDAAYRKTLSSLRKYINVVETKMSAKQWNEIEYQSVPSRAGMIYSKAFRRHDEEGYAKFIDAVNKGEATMHAATLYPYEIVHQTLASWHDRDQLASCEAMWKSLPTPEDFKQEQNTIVVCDGSGSMCTSLAGTSATALELAYSLAIYFAERMTGPFKDRYITFSSHPELIDLTRATSLYDRLAITRSHRDCSNTNLEGVFDLILDTAVRHEMTQEQLPANILIISDMEFDSACQQTPNERLFTTISNKYAAHGYKLPRLIFWNACSRTGTIPIKENDLGVALVSGFSQNNASMVFSGKTDPFEVLLEKLNSERYAAVEEAWKQVS